MMTEWRRKKWQQFYGRPTNCAIMWFFCALFVTYFVHDFSANVSYGKKMLLDIRTAITHLGLDKDVFFKKQEAQDVLQTPDKAEIPVISKKKRHRFRGHRAGSLVNILRRLLGNLPLPSISLANVQSVDKKLDEVRSRISYQRDIKNYNILCFTESWLMMT